MLLVVAVVVLLLYICLSLRAAPYPPRADPIEALIKGCRAMRGAPIRLLARPIAPRYTPRTVDDMLDWLTCACTPSSAAALRTLRWRQACRAFMDVHDDRRAWLHVAHGWLAHVAALAQTSPRDPQSFRRAFPTHASVPWARARRTQIAR